MAMVLILINCGFAISAAMGAFGSMSEYTGIFNSLQALAKPYFQIGPFEINGIITIVGILIIGTALFVNSRAFSSEGVAYAVFFGVFWLSVGTSTLIFYSIRDSDGNLIPGINIFITIFLLVSALIFINAFVQMPTGGQKTHV